MVELKYDELKYEVGLAELDSILGISQELSTELTV